MSTPNWLPCPYCGFPNGPRERACKSCGGPLWAQDAPDADPYVADETMHLYHSTDGTQLLCLSHSWFEYDTRHMAFRTPWSNLITIYRGLLGSYLNMQAVPELVGDGVLYRSRVLGKHTGLHHDERRLRLDPFGFPQNRQLCADLRRYAPHLARYVPRA
ncbi:hypothetical protein F8S13_18610 [Chloroflexia bacterium SDU3-3]|nr:hypothetical protein F8S13_18610 [Chloroflexia bacterium SDU3-3]